MNQKVSFLEALSKPFLSLLSVIVMAEISSTMITPILTFLFFSDQSSLFSTGADQSLRSIWYGDAVGLSKMGALLSSMLLGVAMDRYGRRSILALSCLGLGLAMVVCGFAVMLGSVILFITGFVFSNLLYAGKQTTLAMVGDDPRASHKLVRMSVLQSCIAIGACIGPVLAGLLVHTKGAAFFPLYALPIFISAFFGFLSFGMTSGCVPETLDRARYESSTPESYWSLLKNRTVLLILLELIAAQLSWGMYYEFMPPISKLVFHFRPSEVGFFVGSVAFWLILGSGILLPFFGVKYSNFSLKWCSVTSMILGVLVALFGVAMQAKLLFWLSPILMAGGDVILYSVLVSELSNAVSARAQGRMMGMIYILTTSVWAFTGFVGGYLIGGHVEDVLIGMLGGISALWISLSWRGKARVRKGIVQLKN